MYYLPDTFESGALLPVGGAVLAFVVIDNGFWGPEYFPIPLNKIDLLFAVSSAVQTVG